MSTVTIQPLPSSHRRIEIIAHNQHVAISFPNQRCYMARARLFFFVFLFSFLFSCSFSCSFLFSCSFSCSFLFSFALVLLLLHPCYADAYQGKKKEFHRVSSPKILEQRYNMNATIAETIRLLKRSHINKSDAYM
jgi:hypothetical protein